MTVRVSDAIISPFGFDLVLIKMLNTIVSSGVRLKPYDNMGRTTRMVWTGTIQ